MKTLKSVNSIWFNNSAEQVWDLLTKPGLTEKYMYNCRVLSEFTAGASIEWIGEYQGQKAHLTGEVMEIEPMRKLKYTTIDPNFADPAVPENYVHVTCEIRPQNDGMLLTIVNDTFDGNEERMEHIVQGWEKVVFPIMKELMKDKV